MKNILKIVLVVALCLSIPSITGCAGFNKAPGAGKVSTVDRASLLMSDFASTVSAAQQVEISMHQNKLGVDDATHHQIQEVFLLIGTKGSALTQLIATGGSAASIKAAISDLSVTINTDLANGVLGVKNQDSQKKLQTLVTQLSGLLATIGGAYFPAPTTT